MYTDEHKVTQNFNLISNEMSNLSSMAGNEPEEIEEALTPLHMGQHQHDQSGGGEFIGDGIRMHEQPLETRETQD